MNTKRILILTLGWMIWGTQVSAHPPSSQPSVRRATSAPTKQPNPTTSINISLNTKGQIFVDGVSKTLGQWAVLVASWKSIQPTLILDISPTAPNARTLVLTEFLRDAKLRWTRTKTATTTKAVAKIKATTKAKANLPQAKTAPQASKKAPIVWAKVPLGRMRGLKGKQGVIELRAQVLQSDRTPKTFAALGFVIYRATSRQKRRSLLGFLRSNRRGLFRFRFRPEKKALYRISILHNRSIVEFPVFWRRHTNGLLYLRLGLAGDTKSKKATKTSKRPVARKPIAKKPIARKSIARKPIVRTVGVTKKKIIPAKQSAPSLCDWKKTPHIRVKSKNKSKAQWLAIRVQVLAVSGRTKSVIATGLIQRVKNKPIPVGRGKTNTKGCIVYVVDRSGGAIFDVAILHGTGLQMERVPPFDKIPNTPKAHIVFNVRLKKQSRKSLFFGGLHTFFEIRNADWIQVTHVASLFYAPTAGQVRKISFFLPVSKKAVRVQYGRDLAALKPSYEKKGIHLQHLRAGENRFLYGYLLPRNNDGESKFSLLFSHKVNRVFAFFARGQVLPLAGKTQKLKPITRGKGKHARKFWMMKFPPSAPEQILGITVIPKNPPPSGMVGWISRMKRKGKKNKLLGLGTLLTISCLGLFWLISVPRKNPTL